MSAPQTNGHPAASSSSTEAAPVAAPQAASKISPSDVGWQFVPQYYAFVNKQPHRLHCFYNKRSTFVHGEEGDEVTPAHGQQDIHDRIVKIGYDQCKVYINTIDSQSSAGGGIVIQVLGEMSNANKPWRKFAQTFFLAEQPNGYFVLNDIFRYLKEDTDEEDEPEIDEAPVVSAAPVNQAEQAHAAAAPVAAVAVEEEAAPAPEPEVVATPEPEPEVAAPEPEPEVAAPEPEPVVEAPKPVKEAPAPEPEAPKAAPVEKPVEKVVEKAAPAPAPAAPVAAPAAPAPAPAPAAPAKPKSWASLAASGTGAKSWGAVAAAAAAPAPAPAPAPKKAEAVAPAPAAPAPAAPAAAPAAPAAPAAAPAAPAAAAAAPAPAPANGGAASASGRHPFYENALKVNTAHCFVKLPNWSPQDSSSSEAIDENTLRNIASRFGEVLKVEIVKGKACAFVEFQKVESARKAIIASLGTHQGGEGGVSHGEGKLNFETRKEKDERGPKGGRRGGAPESNRPQGGARSEGGNQQQRGSNAGRGRGRGRGGANNAGGDRAAK